MHPKTTREQRLSMLISAKERAMMSALGDRDARNVSEVIRELVREKYAAMFGARTPVTDAKSGRTYLWERIGEEQRLLLASLDVTASPQAILVRSGAAFRIQAGTTRMQPNEIKQLAKAAGIEVI